MPICKYNCGTAADPETLKRHYADYHKESIQNMGLQAVNDDLQESIDFCRKTASAPPSWKLGDPDRLNILADTLELVQQAIVKGLDDEGSLLVSVPPVLRVHQVQQTDDLATWEVLREYAAALLGAPDGANADRLIEASGAVEANRYAVGRLLWELLVESDPLGRTP